MAHAAAMATAEAERRARAGSPQTAKNAPRSQPRATPAVASQPRTRTKSQQRDAASGRPTPPAAGASQPPPPQNKVDSTTLHVVVSVLGLKFQCRVESAWPCEAIIATAVAQYHLAYPTCEIPDFNTIYHAARKEFVKAADAIGSCCINNDELELGMTEKPGGADSSGVVAKSEVGSESSDGRDMFDFVIMFHRLPLGFTLKQSNEHIVVANLYPHSTATHYERLETGIRVVRIADVPLESLGLRHVHDLIKNAAIPLEIHFRGFRAPSLRATLLLAAANPTNPTNPMTEAPREPQEQYDTESASPPPRERSRSRATSSSSASRMVELLVSGESGGGGGGGRKESGSAGGSSKRSGRSRRSSHESRDGAPETTDNQSNNQGGSPAPLPSGQRQSPAAEGVVAAVGADDATATVRTSDRESNQHEDDGEAVLLAQIKTLQVALLKKHEEAKQLARQLEAVHEKLAAVRGRSAKSKRSNSTTSDTVPAPPHSAPATSAASLKLRLTPEVLEAMDSKAGVPPKSASYYQSSNVSSVSGYSNYSNRSNAAPRSARPSVSSRRGHESMLRSDASVTSQSSATGERRNSNSTTPRSPRAQYVKNLSSRYSYVPQRYAASVSELTAPTSLSSRGAVMSRAKATRDSFLPKTESPGVGYYDVKLPSSHVRGGEIGDSDRSLPWP